MVSVMPIVLTGSVGEADGGSVGRGVDMKSANSASMVWKVAESVVWAGGWVSPFVVMGDEVCSEGSEMKLRRRREIVRIH